VLSPCILPILPIILTSTLGGKTIGKARPLGVVTGFILSFTFFTLFLSILVRLSGIPADSLRLVSVVVIASFGVSLLFPQFQAAVERIFSKLARFMPVNQNKTGFGGGLVIGLSVGLLWTPCVGPILASVISLAITGTVTLDAFFITLAYSLGTAIPMFLIMLGGQSVLKRVPVLMTNVSKIQKAFGVLMIATAIGIFFNVDRTFQTFILTTFPQYGSGLTLLEDNELVRNQLETRSRSNNPIKNKQNSLDNTYQQAPELIPGGEWFNSKPLTIEDLKGKVVIIDFWTYSCINCQRTLPYLREWYAKYKDKGLVIIGVHSPEFEFEKKKENVMQALTDFGIEYPVVQDNDFATWRAYQNRYWPAKYIIDADGLIRYTHFGEGAYDETELVIQTLLEEAGASDIDAAIQNPTYIVNSNTPELYLGYGRMEYFDSQEGIKRDELYSYSIPTTIKKNHVAYEGDWNVMEEYANPAKGAKLHLDFDSQEVFLVMRTKGTSSQMKVYVDDTLQYFGEDNKGGIVTVTADTLYKLVLLPTPGRHVLMLEFLDAQTEVFAFTFG